MIVGILLVFVIFAIVWKVSGSKSLKGDYDERQMLIRGIGYKYAFFTNLILLAIYTFMIYLFLKVIYMFASKDFNGMRFAVDWWIVPICLLTGPLYYYGHEWYYKNIYLKKQK